MLEPDPQSQVSSRHGAERMKLRYGFNEIYGWWHMSQGADHREVQRRLKLMGTKVVRLFVFDQPVPSPFKDWHSFERLVQAVLDIGANLGYFTLLPPALVVGSRFFQHLFIHMGFIRYMVMSNLLLTMALLPLKMILRWTINLKYFISLPEYMLNL